MRRLFFAVALVACSKSPAAAPAAAKPALAASSSSSCFSAVVSKNSASTNAVFAKRRVQGGGVTWAALLGVVVGHRAKMLGKEPPASTPGLPGFGQATSVSYGGAETWVVVDEEGDAAVFCSGDARLLSEVHADYDRLNADPAALEKTLGEANPDDLE